MLPISMSDVLFFFSFINLINDSLQHGSKVSVLLKKKLINVFIYLTGTIKYSEYKGLFFK